LLKRDAGDEFEFSSPKKPTLRWKKNRKQLEKRLNQQQEQEKSVNRYRVFIANSCPVAS